MEFQDIELTIEDILAVHRFWITRQYVVENKTEVEIVAELYRRQLVVSVAQVRQCIRSWNLTRPADQKLSEFSHSSSYPTSPYNQHHCPPSPLTPRSLSQVPNQDLYIDRPLPSLPPEISSSYGDISVQSSYTHLLSQSPPSSSSSLPQYHPHFTDHALTQSLDLRHQQGAHSSAYLELDNHAGAEQDECSADDAGMERRLDWPRAHDARKGKPKTKRAIRLRHEKREKDIGEGNYRNKRRGEK